MGGKGERGHLWKHLLFAPPFDLGKAAQQTNNRTFLLVVGQGNHSKLINIKGSFEFEKLIVCNHSYLSTSFPLNAKGFF